jgi:ACS family glucarate transporter-like MFS transporter
VRYVIVAMLFLASCFSYGDRAALSVAGVPMQKALAITPLKFGWLLSGFGWAYVLGQLPSGGLLDRFGSKLVYGISIVGCAVCAFLVALAGSLPLASVFVVIFALRLLSGLAQAPVFPGNGRIVAAWFPAAERGRASAAFNASQYFAVVLFAPIFGWLTHRYGWQSCFWFIGCCGLALAFAWKKKIWDVKEHPRISDAEISHIELGGGLVNTGRAGTQGKGVHGFLGGLAWPVLRALLGQRLLVGIYLGQFCTNTITTFFLTWFPSYLSETRHLSIVKVGFLAAVPAMCGCTGGFLGGIVSDRLLRNGVSLTWARKLPIIAGLLLSITMIGCNYTGSETVVMSLMSLAFFGKGFGALGWTVIADVSPRSSIGVNAGVFNFFGNLSTISTPIVIGLIKTYTGSYKLALVFVGVTALVAIFSYLAIVGELKRVEIAPAAAG